MSGYNIFGFDEKYLKAYLSEPYPLSLANQWECRIDILPLVQAAEHLYPNALIYPLNAKGRTSKLEDIAPANGFENHKAHDALGDVEATIFVAKLIKTKAPTIWKAALGAKKKKREWELTEACFLYTAKLRSSNYLPAAIIEAFTRKIYWLLIYDLICQHKVKFQSTSFSMGQLGCAGPLNLQDLPFIFIRGSTQCIHTNGMNHL